MHELGRFPDIDRYTVSVKRIDGYLGCRTPEGYNFKIILPENQLKPSRRIISPDRYYYILDELNTRCAFEKAKVDQDKEHLLRLRLIVANWLPIISFISPKSQEGIYEPFCFAEVEYKSRKVRGGRTRVDSVGVDIYGRIFVVEIGTAGHGKKQQLARNIDIVKNHFSGIDVKGILGIYSNNSIERSVNLSYL